MGPDGEVVSTLPDIASFKTAEGLVMCHINVQSILNKLESLEFMLNKENVDVLCLTEHWLDADTALCLQIKGYSLLSCFCRNSKIHGGSLILVKNNLKHNFKGFNNIENASIEAHSELCGIFNDKYCIVCCYRPPSGNMDIFTDSVSSALSMAYKRGKYLVFCGDLNINFYVGNEHKKQLLDLFDSFRLCVTTTEPTRICTYSNGHTSKSILDYVATNIPNNAYECTIFNPHLSDHLGHRFIFKIFNNFSNPTDYESNNIFCRNLSKDSLALLSNFVMSRNWGFIISSSVDGDTRWMQFTEHILYCLNCCCPYKYIKIKKSQSGSDWYNINLSHMKTELDKIYWMQKNTHDIDLIQKYRELKKSYKQEINNAKKSYYQRKIENSDNKNKIIWSLVNENLKRNSKHSCDIKLEIDGEIITQPTDIVNKFAVFFSTIPGRKLYEKYGDLTEECTTSPCLPNSIFVTPVNEDEILKTCEGLKNKKSSGFDDLNTNILKEILPHIKKPLTFLINSSLKDGAFPDVLKVAKVVPIYKKNKREDMRNYRQISILSIFSKVFEKIVYNKFVDFLNKNNVLTLAQHGFQQNRSIETASCRTLNYVYRKIDKGELVMTIFFDLSIAFDTINRKNLITKLYNMGIRGTILNWVDSYMSDRKILVKYNGAQSQVNTLELGVPQGSVLGPLLFILYVNDLPANIKQGHVTMYADDTTITVSAGTSEELCQNVTSVCNDMNIWCRKNGLILNTDKTVYMSMFNRKPVNNLEDKLNIKLSESVKFLGSLIDPQLTYSSQIDHVCSKLNSAYFAILSLKNTLDVQGLLSVYYALAFSHMANNVVCWGSAQCNRIFICQKRILRLIFGIKARESCREIFIRRGILTFPSIYIHRCLSYLNNNRSMFQRVGSTNPYNTRGNNLLTIPCHKTSYYKNSPFYNCVTLFNKLPAELRCFSGNLFTSKVKSFLLRRGFYSVKEYLLYE